MGATLLLVALRPLGWAPARVVVLFLAGGAASLAAPNARSALLAGALLTGASLVHLAVRSARAGSRLTGREEQVVAVTHLGTPDPGVRRR